MHVRCGQGVPQHIADRSKLKIGYILKFFDRVEWLLSLEILVTQPSLALKSKSYTIWLT